MHRENQLTKCIITINSNLIYILIQLAHMHVLESDRANEEEQIDGNAGRECV